LDLDEMPTPNRRGRRESAPVRSRERGEGESERGPPQLAAAGRGRARVCKPRVELAPGAEQEHVTLEVREPECLDEPGEGDGTRALDGQLCICIPRRS